MSALLQTPLPALNDSEGAHVPESLPDVIDAHMHLFPDNLFESIWQWFEKYGWPMNLNHIAGCWKLMITFGWISR